MYSLVLMAALVNGGQAPHWFAPGPGCPWCQGIGSVSPPASGFAYGLDPSVFFNVRHGCYGCYGCYGTCNGSCYGACSGGVCLGGFGAPAYPLGGTPALPEPVAPPKAEPKKKNAKPDESPSGAAQARLIVELPAGAKLFVDGRQINRTAGHESFSTPDLRPGAAYYYEVRIEVMREGRPVSETRRVVIRAGQVVREDFRAMGVVSTAKTP